MTGARLADRIAAALLQLALAATGRGSVLSREAPRSITDGAAAPLVDPCAMTTDSTPQYESEESRAHGWRALVLVVLYPLRIAAGCVAIDRAPAPRSSETRRNR